MDAVSLPRILQTILILNLIGVGFCSEDRLDQLSPEEMMKLDSLQLSYSLAREEIQEKQWVKPMEKLRGSYKIKLEQLVEKFSRVGDLDKALAAREAAKSDPKPQTTHSKVKEIAEAQKVFIASQVIIKERMNELLAKLARSHVVRLTTIKKKLTQMRRFESALSVQEIISSVDSHIRDNVRDETLQLSVKKPSIRSADLQAEEYFLLGENYRNARGVKKDDAKALKWYQLAAERGHPAGRRELGFMYSRGLGVEIDKERAIELYRLAAAQGDGIAQWYLGFHHYSPEKGDGLTQDYKEAERWVRMAAEQGVAGAQNAMGVFYLNGEGVIKDDEQAVKWFKAAAAQGNERAIKNLRLLGHIK